MMNLNKEKETMEVANEILTSVEREKFNNLEELIAKIKDSLQLFLLIFLVSIVVNS